MLWMGSRMMAAVSGARRDFTLSMLPNSAKLTLERSSPVRYFPMPVALNAPVVRPWNPPFMAMMPFLPVNFLATRIAASFASAPELQKNTLPNPGAAEMSASAASARMSLYATLE